MMIRLMDFAASVDYLRSDLLKRGYTQLADTLVGIPVSIEGATIAAGMFRRMPAYAEGAALETARLMAHLASLEVEPQLCNHVKNPIELAA